RVLLRSLSPTAARLIDRLGPRRPVMLGTAGQHREAEHHRPARPEAVDEAAGGHGEQHRQDGEERYQRSDGEGGSAELQGEERRRHAAADEAQVPERVQEDEVGDFHGLVHTVMATPVQVTPIPTRLSALGTTWKSASSRSTAKIGGRYIMLVTRVASPWRMSTCSALTARTEAQRTRNAIADTSCQSQCTVKPSTAIARGASTAAD